MDINFSINGSDDVVTSTSGYYYLDSSTPYKAYIGAYRTAASTWSDGFLGFMYNFYIDDEYLTGRSAHQID